MLQCYKRRSTTSSTSAYFSTRVGVRVDAVGNIWAGLRETRSKKDTEEGRETLAY